MLPSLFEDETLEKVMEIKEVTKLTTYYVEVIDDDGEYQEYTRYGDRNWMVRMGESNESFYDYGFQSKIIDELELAIEKINSPEFEGIKPC